MTRRLLTLLTALLLASTVAACTDTPALDDIAESATWADTTTRPSFALWKSADGQFRFRLVDAKAAILATSEGYTSRLGALNGLLSVLANGGDRSRYQVIGDATSGHFTLKAPNGEIIATGTNKPSLAAAQAAADATVAAVGAYRAAWTTATGRRFAVRLDAGGKYYWNLHAGNGEIVLHSERYDSEAAALNGAFSVLDNGATAARYQVLKAQSGQYYLNLTATNGQVIGTSELYATKSNAERARDALIALVPTVVIL